MDLSARSSVTPSTLTRWTSCEPCRASAALWQGGARLKCRPLLSWMLNILSAASYTNRRKRMPEERRVLLEVRNLKKHFPLRQGFLGRGGGTVKAVDGINLHILQGETLGLVGESGSGKTTAGRTILRAFNPTEGEIIFHLQDGLATDLAKLSPAKLRAFRRHAQMIFQDPYSSLNPRMTVRDIIAEPLVAGGVAQGDEVDERVRETARRCQLSLEHLRRYPHAFSGGQRQRIGIARALVVQPQFVVC